MTEFVPFPKIARLSREIIVTEKIDGTNSQIFIGEDGEMLAGSRNRWLTIADDNSGLGRWSALLDEGEAIHGEWLAMAHGTRYDLPHEPFVAFDLTRAGVRVLFDELTERAAHFAIVTPHVISDGPPISVAAALEALGPMGRHGALETVEGAVWRVERKGKVDFIAKFVRPDKQDGKYLAEIAGCDPYWHWLPGLAA